jgi:SAM-dependent methyltransferase
VNDPRFTAAFWDQRYALSARMWSGNPNPALVEQAAALPPGTALDAGCGEGADALWLGRQGWRVTAVDVSATALRHAAAHTSPELVDRITWREADLLTWTPEIPGGNSGQSGYDLVVSAFMQFPGAPRRRVFATLAASVAPGGTLIIIGHHPSDLNSGIPRPPEPDLYYSPGELADDLPAQAWTIHTQAARPRESTDPDGRPVTIHDTVLRAQRRSRPDGADRRS